MDIYTPYTYLIGWSKQNKFYYGRRTAKNCHPSEFWIKYFTSSKEVEKFRQIYGEPDVIQIRKTFPNNPDRCKLWECKVLEKIDAQNNPIFLNKKNGDYKWDTTGIPSWNKDKKLLDLINYKKSKIYKITTNEGKVYLVTGKLSFFCRMHRVASKTLKENKIPDWRFEEIDIPRNEIKSQIMLQKNDTWEEASLTQSPKRNHIFSKKEDGTSIGKITQLKRVQNKSHNLLLNKGSVPCYNKTGSYKRICSKKYHSQIGFKENWEWVHMLSKEGKRRKYCVK